MEKRPAGSARTRPDGALPVLLAAQFVSSLGDGAYYVASALFFTRVAGLSPGEVATGLSLAWATGAAATPAIGRAADRRGLRLPAMALACLVAAALLFLGGLGTLPGFGVGTLPGFAATIGVYAVAQSALGALRQALLARLVPSALRVRARARLQAGGNIGLGLGAALGSLALVADNTAAYRTVFWADALAFLAAAAVMTRLPPTTPSPSRPTGAGTRNDSVLHDRRYLTATALNAVLHLYMPLLSVLAPLWIATRTAAPAWTVGALFVINTAGVAALQPGAARRVTDLRGAARSLLRGSVLLALGGLLVGASAAAPPGWPVGTVLAAGGLVLVLGEVAMAAGSWETGFTLAHPAHPGQWLGMYGTAVPVARALGPVVLVGAVFTSGRAGWLAVAALFVLAGVGLAALAARSGP